MLTHAWEPSYDDTAATKSHLLQSRIEGGNYFTRSLDVLKEMVSIIPGCVLRRLWNYAALVLP